jgi:hypothetical protein
MATALGGLQHFYKSVATSDTLGLDVANLIIFSSKNGINKSLKITEISCSYKNLYTRKQVLSRKHQTLKKNRANYKGMGSATQRQTLIQSSFCLREGLYVLRASRFRVHRV